MVFEIRIEWRASYFTLQLFLAREIIRFRKSMRVRIIARQLCHHVVDSRN